MKCVPIAVNACAWEILVHTHTEVTNAMSTIYTTLDYEYRRENKGTGLILVPIKRGVYK